MGAYILPAEPRHLSQEINFWYSLTVEYNFVSGLGIKKGVSCYCGDQHRIGNDSEGARYTVRSSVSWGTACG